MSLFFYYTMRHFYQRSVLIKVDRVYYINLGVNVNLILFCLHNYACSALAYRLL